MLLSRRVVQAPDLGALHAEVSVLHTRYRIFVEVFEGVVHDDRLFLQAFSRQLDPRSSLIIPLQGQVLVRSPGGDRAVQAGGYMTELRSSGWHMRYEPTVTLVVEWVPGFLSTRAITPHALGKLAPASLQRLRAAVRPLIDPRAETEDVSRCVARILAVLRAEGFPFDPLDARDLVEAVPAWAPTLIRMTDNALSSMAHKPTLQDFEGGLGWSIRQIQRRLGELQRRYAYNATGGWRDMHWRWRLVAGTLFMSVPGATTEGVASRLGYASPRAFCDAFAQAGLPSPGSVRKRLHELS